MKEKAFINAKNLPSLKRAFSEAVGSLSDKDNALNVSIIGEPGVGKSFITARLSKGVLGSHTHTLRRAVPREKMNDLILWSTHTNGKEQTIQYDEASLRFVDNDYNLLVEQERLKSPTPERTLPGITFIEHPNLETENTSDIVVRMTFSDKQKSSIDSIQQKITDSDRHIMAHRKALAHIAALGCEIEIETKSDRIDEAPLIKFFEKYGSATLSNNGTHGQDRLDL